MNSSKEARNPGCHLLLVTALPLCNKRRLKTTFTVQFWLSKAEERRYGTKAKRIRAIPMMSDNTTRKRTSCQVSSMLHWTKLSRSKIFGGYYPTQDSGKSPEQR